MCLRSVAVIVACSCVICVVFCSQGNNRHQFRIVFYFHVEMGTAAACVFVILFHGVCCLRFLFYVLVIAASCLGGFPYAVFKIFKVMQHIVLISTHFVVVVYASCVSFFVWLLIGRLYEPSAR